MQNMLKRLGLGVLGMVITLAWWSYRGPQSASTEVEGIPAKVWEGGSDTLAVEIESSTAARFSIGFDQGDKSLQTWTRVTPGTHTWTISVPKGAGGIIELSADGPKVGDKLSWKVKLNGETVDEQSETLEQPLKAGYGFFLQSEYDDYTAIEKKEAGN